MAFATHDDLELFTGATYDEARANLLLDIATATIRARTAQTLSRVTGHQVVLAGTAETSAVLPERPVVSVAEVSWDGDVLDEGTWEYDGYGSISRYGGWRGQPITVTYTHGFDPIPDDLKGLCLVMVQRALDNPTGIASESIGSYSVSYGRQSGVYIAEDELAIVDRYRQNVHSLG